MGGDGRLFQHLGHWRRVRGVCVINFIYGFLLGVAFVLAWPILTIMCTSLYWACRDVIDLCRHGQIKPGASRLNWAWIAPKMFCRYMWQNIRWGLSGGRRVE